MSETIILRHKRRDYFLKYIKTDELFNMYKENSEKKILFKIFYHFSSSLLSFYFGEWKYYLKNCNKVIIFDNMYNLALSRFIKKKNKNCKIILYFWNKVNAQNEFILKSKFIDEFYTFNWEDSKKYKLSFNPQFYSSAVPFYESKIKNDIVFLGLAKNRSALIDNLESQFIKLGLKCDFKVISDYKDFISYEEYLDMLSSSNCILDLGDTEFSGLTLRALEALFMDKKLITNYKNIVNYDFYNKNNIFILDKDDFKDLRDFLERPIEKVLKNIKNKYEYENWKKNFKKEM